MDDGIAQSRSDFVRIVLAHNWAEAATLARVLLSEYRAESVTAALTAASERGNTRAVQWLVSNHRPSIIDARAGLEAAWRRRHTRIVQVIVFWCVAAAETRRELLLRACREGWTAQLTFLSHRVAWSADLAAAALSAAAGCESEHAGLRVLEWLARHRNPSDGGAYVRSADEALAWFGRAVARRQYAAAAWLARVGRITATTLRLADYAWLAAACRGRRWSSARWLVAHFGLTAEADGEAAWRAVVAAGGGREQTRWLQRCFGLTEQGALA